MGDAARALHSVPDEPVAEAPPPEKVVAAVEEDPNSYKMQRVGERYTAVIHELRERPGVWFRIVTWPNRHRTDKTLARDIRAGKRGFVPAGSFEVVSGFTKSDQAALWCRYMPRERPPADPDQLMIGDVL